MSTHTLTVRFHGICTHFRDVIAGVPHRTVFPDATPWRRGRVNIGHQPERDYTILPHFTVICTPEGSINVPPLIHSGRIVRGVRLQIVNATGELTYDDSFEDIPALTDYVPHYRPSTEVVHGGRAMCYFDVFSGRVTTEVIKNERHTVITMPTNGTPVLQVTPLVAEFPVQPAFVWTHELDSPMLTVMSASRQCRKHSSLDFLLNYLTGQGGIPHAVKSTFPLAERQSDSSRPAEPRHIISEEDLVPPPPEDLCRCLGAAVEEGELLMCSDSRYP